MQYTRIQGLNISKLTLGTVQLGMNYGIANKNGKPDRKKSFEILKSAIGGGVNSFDTAMLYGDSEEVLGSFFTSDQCSLPNPLLTTKFKVSGDSNLSALEIEKQIYSFVEGSLERLKIRQIPIYMTHNAQDIMLYGKILADTFKKLLREGLIKKAAASVYTSDEAEEMLKYDVYDAIQIPMNIFDARFINSGVLKRLHAQGKIIFVRSIFLQGLFLMEPSLLTGNLKDAAEPLKTLRALAEDEGMSIGQLALSYIRDMEEVSSIVMGVDDPQQVAENIAMLEGPSISEDTIANAKKAFADIPVHVLNPSLWNK